MHSFLLQINKDIILITSCTVYRYFCVYSYIISLQVSDFLSRYLKVKLVIYFLARAVNEVSVIYVKIGPKYSQKNSSLTGCKQRT